MALATGAWRESLARSVLIQVSSSATSGALSSWRPDDRPSDPASSGTAPPAGRDRRTAGRRGHRPRPGLCRSCPWPAPAPACRRHAGVRLRLGLAGLGLRRRQRRLQRVDLRSVRHARKRITTAATPPCRSCPESHSASAGARTDSARTRRQSSPANKASNCAWFSVIAPSRIAGHTKPCSSRRL